LILVIHDNMTNGTNHIVEHVFVSISIGFSPTSEIDGWGAQQKGGGSSHASG
jgi:hypothetical protein